MSHTIELCVCIWRVEGGCLKQSVSISLVWSNANKGDQHNVTFSMICCNVMRFLSLILNISSKYETVEVCAAGIKHGKKMANIERVKRCEGLTERNKIMMHDCIIIFVVYSYIYRLLHHTGGEIGWGGQHKTQMYTMQMSHWQYMFLYYSKIKKNVARNIMWVMA